MIRHQGSAPRIRCSSSLLGCVVDSLGRPMKRIAESDGNAELSAARLDIERPAPKPFERAPISEIFETGCKVIDTFVTLGKGQRICVLAEPGVGKSTLLGNFAKSSSAEANVIALVGERGREVQEFIDGALTPETRGKTVVVASTSDESSLSRATAPLTAQRIAEYFRSAGLDVLLQVDSLTRYIRALRELGLAAGELPVRRGYPPSVFTKLPELIERAGTEGRGSITAVYTTLTSASFDEDPMIEEIKAVTDGHIVLSKQLADEGRFPAVDILRSLSRIQPRLLNASQLNTLRTCRAHIARFEAEKDLLAFGATLSPEGVLAAKCCAALTDYFNDSASRSVTDAFEDLSSILSRLSA